MKQFTAIILSLFLVFSFSGIQFTAHYCAGELDSVQFFTQKVKKCCEDTQKTCCEDKETKISLKDTFVKADFSVPAFVGFIPFFYKSYLEQPIKLIAFLVSKRGQNKAPPYIKQSIYLFNESFLN